LKNQNANKEISKPPKWWVNWLRAFDYAQPRTALRRYTAALLLTLFALLFKLFLQELTNPNNLSQAPFITFYLIVTLSAIYGGSGPGLLATFLSVGFANFFLIAPVYNFGFNGISEVINSMLFVINGVIISLICGWLRKELGRRREIAEECQSLPRNSNRPCRPQRVPVGGGARA
jgi:K+-sensing histidine kinase KdpD